MFGRAGAKAGSEPGGQPLIGAGGKAMSFVVEPQQAKKPGQRLTRVLVAAAVVLVVSPLAWMAMSHLTISKSLNHVQVRLNFAALIDWSSEGPRLGEGTCAQMLGIQTVALMFLTTGPIPHERTWRLWLEGAAGWLPYQGLPVARQSACSGGEEQWQRVVSGCDPGMQHLYKLYVHALPNFTGYDPSSIFHGSLVPYRVVTEWGGMSLVVAERLLLQAALQDPSNSRFLLVSDSGIPLYDPLTFYQQLMHEDKSRVKACRNGYLSDYRWHPVMALKGIRRSQWRKSSQWFGLTRKHAELVANDEGTFGTFSKYCRGWDDRRSVECYPDEHYIPTLLSVEGLENETYCGGYGLAATNWTWGGPHPRAWRSREIKPWLMEALRMTGSASKMAQCNNGSTVIQDSQRMFVALRPAVEASQPGDACAVLQEAGQSVITTYARPLPGDCPLTARKFPKFTTVAVHSLMKRTCLGGSLEGNCTDIKAARVLQPLPGSPPAAIASVAGRRVMPAL